MTALQTTTEQLSEALSRLASQWDATASVWSDAARLWFETQYWQDYDPAVRAALEQLAEIGQVIDQARSALED